MNQTVFLYNNSCSLLLILIVYCIAYYYMCILYTFNVKNNLYLPFSSSSFDEISIIDLN